jgi:alkaline phosphatase D
MHRIFLCALACFVLLSIGHAAADAGQRKPKLSHGPVAGAVTATTARIFARTDSAASVKIRYATARTLVGAVESAAQATTKQTDRTTQIQLTGLQPDTVYYLDIAVNGMWQLTTPFPHFKTFPVEALATPFKFVVLNDFGTKGSDNPPSERPVKTFARAGAEEPDFVLIGGDFFHTDADRLAEKRALFRHNYELNSPAAPMDDFITEILRKYPLAHMWDDHDIGTNNANKLYPFKAEARRALTEYFPVYPPGIGGDYQTFTYAHAQFWLLDSRSFRDPQGEPDGPAKSMLDGDNLGAEGQLEWLLDGLEQSTARWKFIVSPVPFNRTLVKKDSWNGYAYERQEIVNFIESNDITGVIMLSGDLHMGAMDDGTYSFLPEMLVPGPNLAGCETTREAGLWSEGVYVRQEASPLPCNGYGVVTVLTEPDRVLLQVKNPRGRIKLELPVE